MHGRARVREAQAVREARAVQAVREARRCGRPGASGGAEAQAVREARGVQEVREAQAARGPGQGWRRRHWAASIAASR